jgi:hypothetical protein
VSKDRLAELDWAVIAHDLRQAGLVIDDEDNLDLLARGIE